MTWHLPVWNWLVHAAVGGLLLLAVGGLAVRLCREPVRRLRLIELTLLGCLLLPWLNRLPGLPNWGPAWLAEATPAEEPPLAPAQPPERTASVGGSLAVAAPAPKLDEDTISPANTPPAAPPTDAAPASVPAPAPALTTARAWFSPTLLVVVAFLAAAAGLLLYWLLGLALLWRLCRSGRPAPPDVVRVFRDLAGPGGGGVSLLASDRVELPLMFCWWRPVILLPARLCHEGDTNELRFCLAHEWSHVERRDMRAWHLATLAQFLFFYVPVYWWLRRQLRCCQDFLADARAAEQAAVAEDYAAFLVRAARRVHREPVALALGVADRRSNLYRRILMLIHPTRPLERGCRRGWALAAGVAALLTLAGAATLRLDAASPARDDPKEKPKTEIQKGETLKYTGKVTDKDTGKAIKGATVTVRRSKYGDPTVKEDDWHIGETRHVTDADGKYNFVIPPEQSSQRYLYIEVEVAHPDYASYGPAGYALSMIRKNEKLGGRPFYENLTLRPGKAITGTLETPDGKPAVGVKVLAYSRTNKTDDSREYGSFTNTRTDARGQFRIVLTTPGHAVFWLLPEKYAPSTHVLKNDKRGDLGTFALQEGVVLKGKVLDARGKPMPNVFVNAEKSPRDPDLDTLRVSDSIRRGALSNARGEFELKPLPHGDYRVQPNEHSYDPTSDSRRSRHRPLTGVFAPQTVTLKNGAAADVEVRAMPHVTIEAQYLDGKGKKTRGHECFVFGRVDGKSWFGQGRADADGKIVALVPHGLEDARMDLMTNEHGVLRWRKGPKDELKNRRQVEFGTLKDDVKGIEIIRYTAPILIVKVIAKDGGKLEEVAVSADYPMGKGQFQGGLNLGNGLSSDVSFEKQKDGRHRSSQLLPDEEVTVKGHAKGYSWASTKVKLAEGVEKEIVITLEKK